MIRWGMAGWIMVLMILGTASGAMAGEAAKAMIVTQTLAPVSPTPITGAPGVSLGLDLVVDGQPAGKQVILDVLLSGPKDEKGNQCEYSWQKPAWAGQPCRVEWEFAHDWEVVPGLWTMTASNQGQVLAQAAFKVIKAMPGAGGSSPEPEVAELKSVSPSKGAGGDDGAKMENNPPSQAALQPLDQKKVDKQGQKPRQSENPTQNFTPKLTGKTAPAPGKTEPAQAKAEQPKLKSPAPAQAKMPEPKLTPAQAKELDPKPLSAPEIKSGPGGKVFVVSAGVFSDETRAKWLMVLLREQRVKACLRVIGAENHQRWMVVAGWEADLAKAKQLKLRVAKLTAEVTLTPMSVSDLRRGLDCK